MLPPGGKQLTDAHVNINIMLIRLVSRFVLRESQRVWLLICRKLCQSETINNQIAYVLTLRQ